MRGTLARKPRVESADQLDVLPWHFVPSVSHPSSSRRPPAGEQLPRRDYHAGERLRYRPGAPCLRSYVLSVGSTACSAPAAGV
jgi:hypothetical protein